MSINAGSMLRHLNGKYSAYDMSQYIFWTGDEDGVAKAVEELIDEGLMSRENAIEFLNDIRLGIDYLENTYSLKHGEAKNVSSLTENSYSNLDYGSFIDNSLRSNNADGFNINHRISSRRDAVQLQLQLSKVS